MTGEGGKASPLASDMAGGNEGRQIMFYKTELNPPLSSPAQHIEGAPNTLSHDDEKKLPSNFKFLWSSLHKSVSLGK